MVSALDSGSRGLGLSPGRVIVLFSWARHFTLTVPLSTQEYKWNSQGNLTKYWVVARDGLASHPGGSSNTPSRFLLRKPGQAPAVIGHWLVKPNLVYIALCKCTREAQLFRESLFYKRRRMFAIDLAIL